MTEDFEILKDVVVIGYGKTTKKEVTGSIATIKSDDFNQGSIASPFDLINGKIAGLNIIRSGGADPNGGISIQLRGTTSMKAGASPLVIIDNVIGGTLESINPEEIETIDVLKDGSAAAIYGTRGTNGVILITTKQGKKNSRTSVDFSTRVSFQRIYRKIDALSATEFREVLAKGHTGFDGGSDTDWMDAISRKVPITHYYNLGISGGSANTSYRAAVSYEAEQGLILKSDRNTLRARMNISQKAINDRLKLDYNLNVSNGVYHPTDYWAIQQALRRNPTEPIYDENDKIHGGYYTNNAPFNYYNPVALLKESEEARRMRVIMGSVKATFDITEALSVSAVGSFNIYSGGHTRYQTRYYPQGSVAKGDAYIRNFWNHTKMLDITADYNKKYGGHSFSTIVGYSYTDNIWENNDMWNKNFDTDYFKWNNIGNGTGLLNGEATMGSSKESSKLIAFFGRLMYNYMEKYLLSVSIRYEGSSRFGTNYKYGLFPALSIGWRINQEKFMQNIKWIDDLKLRIGYGVTGNQDIANYQSMARLSPSGKFYYNGEWINSYGPASNKNDDLKWERKGEFNIGLDFAFLNGRLAGTIDWYNRITKDLLFTYSVPVPPNLYGSKFTNVGVIQNTGIEVTLSGIPIKTDKFQWNSTLTLSHNKNLLKSFSNKDYAMQYLEEGWLPRDFKQFTERIYEGQPIGNFFGPVFTGMDENGNATYKGVAPGEPVDESVYEIIGNAFPDVIIGWTNNFSYRGFNLSMLFRASIGNEVANINRLYYEGYYYFGGKNILRSTFDSPDNIGQTTWSSHFVEDGSFLKLSNLTLSYTFKPKVSWMNSFLVYINGQNLFTFTKYKGIDPEVNLNGLAPGIAESDFYPVTRIFTLGVNFKF